MVFKTGCPKSIMPVWQFSLGPSFLLPPMVLPCLCKLKPNCHPLSDQIEHRVEIWQIFTSYSSSTVGNCEGRWFRLFSIGADICDICKIQLNVRQSIWSSGIVRLIICQLKGCTHCYQKSVARQIVPMTAIIHRSRYRWLLCHRTCLPFHPLFLINSACDDVAQFPQPSNLRLPHIWLTEIADWRCCKQYQLPIGSHHNISVTRVLGIETADK